MIIVTGGAGFIGSVLIQELNKNGRSDIIVVDRLRDSEKWKNLRQVKFEDFIHADELFDSPMYRAATPIKAIYHLGACSATTEKNVDYLFKNNVEYSKKLFSYAAQNQIPFLYASSAATYGAGELGYNDGHEGIDKLVPLNPYGYSKQVFDEWVLKQKRLPPKWFGVKFFNVYGPNEYHKGPMRSVVYQAFQQIKEGGRVKLFKSYRQEYADGGQKRDFIYACDAVRALVGLMNDANANSSGVYNLGTGKARSFDDLAKSVFKAMNLNPQIDYIEMPENLRGQYQYFTEANMQKFFKALPEFRFMSLEEGIADYVKSYLATENPFIRSY